MEAAKRQLVPISATLTEVPVLAALPVPAVRYNPPACTRLQGCYSTEQFDAALSAALDWGARSADNLRAIRAAGESATQQEPRP